MEESPQAGLKGRRLPARSAGRAMAKPNIGSASRAWHRAEIASLSAINGPNITARDVRSRAAACKARLEAARAFSLALNDQCGLFGGGVAVAGRIHVAPRTAGPGPAGETRIVRRSWNWAFSIGEAERSRSRCTAMPAAAAAEHPRFPLRTRTNRAPSGKERPDRAVNWRHRQARSQWGGSGPAPRRS